MNSEVNQYMCMNLSTDPETGGFDLQAGQTWIYPTNYPIRDYQFNIVQKALLENTLVSLPTGLGKTFIAAVVMYNFFRWYPQGKVIFMAPTRPLVKQQVDACYDIMAIPREVTAELTGTKISNTRKEIWNDKRVFFITPQILENDLETFQDLGPRIKCIVFDEAHKARGNHAYCEVIKKLSLSNKYFRVLALSATPGGAINDVLEVVQNLLISHLEVRTEESLDVNPYVFHRNLTTIVVPLGEKLQSVKDEYMKVLECYTRSLIKFKVIQGNCGSLTKGKIFMTMKNFQQNSRGTSPNYGEIMRSLNICVTLYHAYELLVRHGLRSFLTFYEEHIDKPLLRGNTSIIAIMKDVNEYLRPAAKLEQLPDGGYPKVSKDIKFGHPKFYKLRDILVDHFNQKGDLSRVIVFFEFRDSVMEAYALLIQSQPVLRPRIFLGQGQGITQKLQINVVRAFREGTCNILLSTSIGEEGLDVGEVDLIVCFDISNKSPIRMVQRMGRTGRKKEGSIIVLVTEGREQQTLKDCLIHKNNVAVHVLGSRELARGLKESSPRLVPEDLVPKCEKIFITVKKQLLKKTSSLKDMFSRVPSSSSEPSFSPDLKIVEINERIPSASLLVTKEGSMDQSIQISAVFGKRIEKQRSFQEIHQVKHSKVTEIFVELLQIADSKRFNIPISQLGTMPRLQNKNLKQTDIRNMFVKSQSVNDFAVPSSQASKIIVSPSIEETSTFGSRELFNEISNFLSIEMTDLNMKCKLCAGKRDCEKNTLVRKPAAALSWIELDESVFSSVNKDDLKLFAKSMDKSDTEFNFEDNLDFDAITTPEESQDLICMEDLIDHSILDGNFYKTCNFEAPKTLNNLIEQYSTSIINVDLSQIKSQTKLMLPEEPKQIKQKTLNIGDVLAFFLLTSIEDIFRNENIVSGSQCTIMNSPDIFELSPEIATTPPKFVSTENSDESSPILGSFQIKRNKKDQSQIISRNLMRDCSKNIESPSEFTMNRTKLSSTPISCTQEKICKSTSNDRNIFALLSSAVGKAMPSSISAMESISETTTVEKTMSMKSCSEITAVEIEMSPRNMMEPSSKTKVEKETTSSKSTSSKTTAIKEAMPSRNTVTCSSETTDSVFEIEDICDISFFAFPGSESSNRVEDLFSSPEKPLTKNADNDHLSDIIEISDICDIEDFVGSGVSLLKNSQHSKKPQEIHKTDRPPSPSQVTITQMISLVNKDNASFEPRSSDSGSLEPKISSNVSQEQSSLSKNNSNQTKNSSTDSSCLLSENLVNTLGINPFLHKNDNSQVKRSSDNGRSNLPHDNPFLCNSKSGRSNVPQENLQAKNNSARHKEQISNEPTNNSQKENLDATLIIDDSDLFDFSFNNKRPTSKKTNVSPVKWNSLNISKKGEESPCLVYNVEESIKNLSLNMSLQSIPSDEEFETKPWMRSKAKVKKKKTISEETSSGRYPKNSNKPKTRKWVARQFVEDEAELSFHEGISVSDDEEDEDSQDCYDASFVADETHYVDTQMHIKYLQSVRSPVLPSKFRSNRRPINSINVYSQEVDRENDTYLDDSFVVHEDQEDTISSQAELTELEILEKKLEKQHKKRKKSAGVDDPERKRRRIIIGESDSD